MTVVGTRPELIKLSRIMASLEKHFKHTLVHTGQNYDFELNQVFFDDLNIKKPEYFLEAAKGNASETIANIIIEIDKVFAKEEPDAILVYGDTNSCLCVIPAKRRQIPIFHMEAGNRCFDQRVPEELNRKIVDHMSDINMVHSEHARRYLLNEGLNPSCIFKTGSPMNEVLSFFKDSIDASDVLNKLDLKKKEFFVVSIHREENVDYADNFLDLVNSLNAIAEKYQKPLIVSTHPRTKKRIDELSGFKFHPLVKIMKPMGFHDYVKLQKESFCVISDSGTITEESSILGFPGIMIRQAHERPEGMDIGAVIMSGLNSARVLDSIDIAVGTQDKNRVIKDYDNENISAQVVKIIQSYVDFVNRTVWRK